ncbi:MAG: 4Fe-4S binding protein, partial [Casimicrobiaceae bacterium]
ATGIDLWLAAVSYGVTGITVLLARDTAPEYTRALSAQARIANDILAALGYQDTAVRVCDELGLASTLWDAPRGLAVRDLARWNAGNDKRATLEMAFDHLFAHAPTPQSVITLAAGAPFGAIRVDAERCTMCLACVGACPEGALLDNPERPELRFIESKCVQCGLCAKTCPENAIALVPQLDLRPEARKPRQLNIAESAFCTRCGKPLGAKPVIERMLSRLTGHRMFVEPKSLERLRMCADCRVIDLYSEEKPVDIRDLP